MTDCTKALAPGPNLELDARLASSTLIVTLSQKGGDPVWVDREMVFELYIEAHDNNRAFLDLDYIGPVRRPPTPVLANRFTLLKPGNSIERRIPLSEPFKTFNWSKSFPQEEVTATESVHMFPTDKGLGEIEVRWRSTSAVWDGIRYYFRYEGIPVPTMCRPLRAVVAVPSGDVVRKREGK